MNRNGRHLLLKKSEDAFGNKKGTFAGQGKKKVRQIEDKL